MTPRRAMQLALGLAVYGLLFAAAVPGLCAVIVLNRARRSDSAVGRGVRAVESALEGR